MTSCTLTIVFTDIKGFTERTSRATRSKMIEMLDRHERLLLPIVRHYGGRVVKTIGDAFLLSFESPTNAVLCGLMMQETLREANVGLGAEDRIDIRVAINTGEVEVIGNDVFGETVNVASRIEGIADAGEVFFSESTYLAMHKAEVPTSEVGTFRLKGIPEEIRVYQVVFDEDLDLYQQVIADQNVDGEPVEDADGSYSRALLYSVEQEQVLTDRGLTGRWIFAAVVLVLVAMGGWLGWNAWSYRSDQARALALIEEGQTQAAIDTLVSLRAARPGDARTTELLGLAVEADLGALQEGERYDEALERLATYRESFPFLETYDALERGLRMDKAEVTFIENRRKGQEVFEALLAEWPEDAQIKYRVAKAHLTWGGRWDVPLRQFLDLVEADPATWAEEPLVRETLLERIEDTNQSSLEEVVATHYFEDPAFQEILMANLYEADPDNADGRHLAHGVVMRAEPDRLEADRYWAVELLGRDSSNSYLLEEAIAWWQDAHERGDAAGRVPDPVPEPFLLRDSGVAQERALPVVDAVFADALRPVLMKHAASAEHRGYRVHAWRLGKDRGWFDPETALALHLANLRDYEDGRWQPHVVDAVTWFEAHPHPDAVPLLEHVRDDMARTWERWGGAGARGNERHAALRDAAARALRAGAR
jgi:class 3 adenylate cyclase